MKRKLRGLLLESRSFRVASFFSIRLIHMIVWECVLSYDERYLIKLIWDTIHAYPELFGFPLEIHDLMWPWDDQIKFIQFSITFFEIFLIPLCAKILIDLEIFQIIAKLLNFTTLTVKLVICKPISFKTKIASLSKLSFFIRENLVDDHIIIINISSFFFLSYQIWVSLFSCDSHFLSRFRPNLAMSFIVYPVLLLLSGKLSEMFPILPIRPL